MAIRAQHVSRNFVQRVISVWLSEEDEEASDHSSDVEDGLPLGSQDIQAHVPIKVNVRVEELLVGGGGTGGEFFGVGKRHFRVQSTESVSRALLCVAYTS